MLKNVPRNIARWLFRPSRMLGLLLLIECLGFGVFIAIQCDGLSSVPYLQSMKTTMSAPNWLLLLGIGCAVTGWIVSGSITLHNSVKQHTINSLLQTRLSATYMKEARAVNKFVSANKGSPDNPIPLALLKLEKNNGNVASINYILNFLEFLAAGIRHGDLHEAVLKDTMMTIVTNFTGTLKFHIADVRGVVAGKAKNNHTLEHLVWLSARWAEKPKKKATNIPQSQPPAAPRT